MKNTIGFIGIGTMGKPMSLNLLKNGFPLVAYDIDPKPLSELKQKGAIIAQSCKEIGSKSSAIITMLRKSDDVEKAILGENGVLEGIKSESTVIDMSTIDPSTSRSIAQALKRKNVNMLDAPVSGGQMGAEAGTLTIMVGGDKNILDKCLDILKSMGKNIHYCGPNGNGEIAKVISNLLSAINVTACAEALSLGVKAGIDFKTLFDVVNATAGQNWAMQFYCGSKAFKGDFEPGFMAELMYKDLGIAMTLGKQVGVPLFVGALSHQIFSLINAAGMGKRDSTILIKVMEDLLNVKLRF